MRERVLLLFLKTSGGRERSRGGVLSNRGWGGEATPGSAGSGRNRPPSTRERSGGSPVQVRIRFGKDGKPAFPRGERPWGAVPVAVRRRAGASARCGSTFPQQRAFPPLSVPIPPTVFPALEWGEAWLRERAPDPAGFGKQRPEPKPSPTGARRRTGRPEEKTAGSGVSPTTGGTQKRDLQRKPVVLEPTYQEHDRLISPLSLHEAGFDGFGFP